MLRASPGPGDPGCEQPTAAGVADSAARFAKAAQEARSSSFPAASPAVTEPDGSGKFITAFFRNPAVTDAVHGAAEEPGWPVPGHLQRLPGLIKLGLVPYGEIRDRRQDSPPSPSTSLAATSPHCPHPGGNRIPVALRRQVGDVVSVPSPTARAASSVPRLLGKLAENGQIATQYVDLDGVPTMDVQFNLTAAIWAVEASPLPDGRVLGKMGHSERVGSAWTGTSPRLRSAPVYLRPGIFLPFETGDKRRRMVS